MIRVIIYESPTKWIITEISESQRDYVREKLTREGYWFVFTETDTN